MNRSENEKILDKIEVSFNRVVPIVILVTIIAAVVTYFGSIPKYFLWLDISIASIFSYMLVFQNKIGIRSKIIVSVAICYIMSIFSFYYGGFDSGGTLLLMSGNILAVVFLKRIYGMMYSLGAVITFAVFWRASTIFNTPFTASEDQWFLQIHLLVLMVVLLQAGVFSMKRYLLSSIENLEKNDKDIRHLAYYDKLTKLPNMDKFRLVLNNKNNKKPLEGYLIFASIKNLSIVKSIHGEDFANELIIETANILRTKGKYPFILAKVSDNQFGFWFEGINREEIFEEFDRYRQLIWTRNKKLENKKRIDCYATFYKHNSQDSIDQSLQKANLSMTYIRQNELEEIVEYDVDFENKLRELELKKELIKSAIDHKNFEVYFQSKVDSRSGEVFGVEALARLRTNEFGFISPGEFIPLIEELNLSLSFGNIIVDKTLAHYKEIQSKYGDLVSVSINVSPSYLMSCDLAKYLQKCINKHEVAYEKVIVEVTEEVALVGLKEVNNRLQAIRELGVKVSLDDFGSGYSSLNYLMSLQVDEIKIDKSFIDQLDDNDRTLSMLDSVRHMADKFNLGFIVEGVERKDQVEKLHNIGCYFIQGYYYSKPEML